MRPSGEILAINDTCPHHGGSLSEADVIDGCVEYPLHAWAFNLATSPMRHAAGVKVRTYPVATCNGDVYVDDTVR